MKLVDLFPESHLLMDVKARDKKGVLRELVEHLVSLGELDEDVARKVEKDVHKREAEGSTGIGKGLAIPHAKNCKSISEVVAVFARSTQGVNFNSVDGGLVHLVFMVASPVELSDMHLRVMKKIAALHRDDKTLKFLRTTATRSSVVEILREIDEQFG